MKQLVTNTNGVGLGVKPFIDRTESSLTISKIDNEDLMSHCLVWLDIERQQPVNALMKLDEEDGKTPVLVDFSGHGKHAELEGFDWTLENGISSASQTTFYKTSDLWYGNVWRPYTGVDISSDNMSISLNESFDVSKKWMIFIDPYNLKDYSYSFDDFKIRVSGLPEGAEVYYRIYGLHDGKTKIINLVSITGDGEYFCSGIKFFDNVKSSSGFLIQNDGGHVDVQDWLDFKIEILENPELPSYAIVTDGVKSKITVKQLTLDSSDFTAIFDLKFMNATNKSSGIVYNGRFYLYENGALYVNTYGVAGILPDGGCIVDTSLNAYDIDGEFISTFFSNKDSQNANTRDMYIGYNSGSRFNKMSLRTFMFFDKVLTEDERLYIARNILNPPVKQA